MAHCCCYAPTLLLAHQKQQSTTSNGLNTCSISWRQQLTRAEDKKQINKSLQSQLPLLLPRARKRMKQLDNMIAESWSRFSDLANYNYNNWNLFLNRENKRRQELSWSQLSEIQFFINARGSVIFVSLNSGNLSILRNWNLALQILFVSPFSTRTASTKPLPQSQDCFAKAECRCCCCWLRLFSKLHPSFFGLSKRERVVQCRLRASKRKSSNCLSMSYG